MTMRTAKPWLICLCALPLLASCGLLQRKPQVVTQSEAIEVPVPAFRPIPDRLTAPILPPPAPAARCVLDGRPAICVLDALATIPTYQADLDQCNADRAATALLGATDGQ